SLFSTQPLDLIKLTETAKTIPGCRPRKCWPVEKRLGLKQARFPRHKVRPRTKVTVRTLPGPFRAERFCTIGLKMQHAGFFSLRDRVWRRGGSEHPDSDFKERNVNTANNLPAERRSADGDSSPATDTPTAARSAQSGTAIARKHSRTS